MLTQKQLAALLQRPLKPSEIANYSLYLELAKNLASSLLCFSFDTNSGSRTYSARDGYRTVYIDPCTEVTSVTIDGRQFDTFTPKQNDSYQGTWFNSIELDDPISSRKVTVTAQWGFGTSLPSDLAMLLAQLFEVVSSINTGQVASKKIEDFQVTFNNSQPAIAKVVGDAAMIISKYATCERGIMHSNARCI